MFEICRTSADLYLCRCLQRFNVAVTRAKALLIVVGNPFLLSKDQHWKRSASRKTRVFMREAQPSGFFGLNPGFSERPNAMGCGGFTSFRSFE